MMRYRVIVITLILMLGLFCGAPASQLTAYASEADADGAAQVSEPSNVEIIWEAKTSVNSGLRVFAEDTVLTISYNGTEKSLTQAQIDAMQQVTYSYSNYNTYPTYGTNNNITGVLVADILAEAGVSLNSLNTNRAIRFVSGDGSGYSAALTVGQIREERYFFDSDGMQIAAVPAIIGFSSSDPGETNLPRNFFGQKAAGEQTRNAFVRSVSYIEVEGDAGTWGSPIAAPGTGTQVSPGDLIRLSSSSGEAKIYYTLDGSEPTRNSTMYNLVGNQWFFNKGLTENAPIVVPSGSGTLILNARIIDFGKADGPLVTFMYPYRSSPDLADQPSPQGLSGGILVLNGTTAAMEYNTSASAPSGWMRCSNGSTSVTAGVYYVRFAATATHNASPSVQVVADKYSQTSPSGLSGGVGIIYGTTTAMQYHTSPFAATGWLNCTNGNTSVAAGTYYVRYTATEIYNASPSVQIIVTDNSNKMDQAAPSGIGGGSKLITGTTAAMEYHTNASAASGWTRCANGGTIVEAGIYYVRYAATETYNASPVVMAVATEEEETDTKTLISVYVSGQMAKEFTQKDIDAIQKHGPSTYSGHNTWPAYETMSGVIGVRIMDLIANSGVRQLSSGQSVRFTSGDGYSTTVTVGQLEEPRYYFSSGGARGERLPSVINFASGSDYRRLAFGQAAMGEQVRQALVKDVVRIDIEGGAGSWGSPSAAPASGSAVAKGAPIRLAMPSGQGDAKIYYTLDGSEPTRSSAVYNLVADRWLSQRGMNENLPISAPGSAAFTIKAKIIGIGKNDGPTVTFTYTGDGLSVNPDDSSDQVLNTTIDDLIKGDVSVDSGKSFFVPAKKGSITWNPDEMDGYYDEKLGGYVFTPKEGFLGTIDFTYIDEDGVEHTLSVEVEAPDPYDSVLMDEADTPLAAGNSSDAGNDGLSSGSGAASAYAGIPQWLFIVLCAACSAAAVIFIPKLISVIRKPKPQR